MKFQGLAYDGEGGLLRNGKPVKSVPSNQGYYRVTYKGKQYQMHRVIYELNHGEVPEGMEIDHINRDRLDNRIENLRVVDKKGNMQNRIGKGYSKQQWSGRYQASIKKDGKRIDLGTWDTKEEAHMAYLKAKEELHGVAP